MLKKFLGPVMALAVLSVAFSFNGCSCTAQMGTQTAAAPPPAPAPLPPPVAPAPPPPVPVKSVGAAKIENNQIKIPGRIEFDVNKATIKNDQASTSILTSLVEVLKANPNVNKIRIEGHTDNTGTPDANRVLAKSRADAVAKYLTDHGIDASRLDAVGKGSDVPLFPNDTEAHKAENRRTEFHLVEVDGKPVR